jgi:hypothetical protein
MRLEEYRTWFADLLARGRALPTEKSMVSSWILFKTVPALAWATEAESAIRAVFPDGHAVRLAWAAELRDNSSKHITTRVVRLLGVFAGAASLVANDRIVSLINTIRIETESELLDQALVLAESDHRAAAAVVAGGALETHLRHYVDKHGIAITGEGSISKYNNTVGQARKTKQGLYSANDGKLIEAWGGYRNEAAHDPGNFVRTKEDVKRMIEGIREFVSRTG